jgi:hypothetical protein
VQLGVTDVQDAFTARGVTDEESAVRIVEVAGLDGAIGDRGEVALGVPGQCLARPSLGVPRGVVCLRPHRQGPAQGQPPRLLTID